MGDDGVKNLGKVPNVDAGEKDTRDGGIVDDEVWPGRIIDGRYRIERKIAKGGMGAVFEAQHLKLNKPVALKIIRPDLASDPEVALRFAREAMVTATLDHPHIVSSSDYGTLSGGGAYLVMRLVRGPSLRDLLKSGGKLPWRKVVSLATQLSDALVTAHRAGIIHRDLKPENILLQKRNDGSWTVNVLDFGIARFTAKASGSRRVAASLGPHEPPEVLTQAGSIIGTPGYMSPEQAMGEQIDGRADYYSLGILMWEMATGSVPFQAKESAELIASQLTEKLPPLARAADDPTLPDALSDLVHELLNPMAKERMKEDGALHSRLAALNGPARTEGDKEVGRSDRPESLGRLAARAAKLEVRAAQLEARQAVSSIRRELITKSSVDRPWLWRSVVLVGVFVAACATAYMLRMSAEKVAHDGAPPRFVVGGIDGSRDIEDGRGEKAGTSVKTAPVDGGNRAADRSGVAEDAFSKRVTTLLRDGKLKRRREAAQWLRNWSTQQTLPPYVELAVALQLAKGCKARNVAIADLAALADDRALPVLERMAALPKTGCGSSGKSDCYGCLRESVAQAKASLEKVRRKRLFGERQERRANATP